MWLLENKNPSNIFSNGKQLKVSNYQMIEYPYCLVIIIPLLQIVFPNYPLASITYINENSIKSQAFFEKGNSK